MPIFEFRCRACGRKTTALVLVRARASEVRCTFCQGADLERLWSRFATIKSEDARIDAMANPSAFADVDESDPRSMMRWMKKMGQEMGEDLGDDLEQAMEEELAPGGAADEGEQPPDAGSFAPGDSPDSTGTGGSDEL